MVGSSRERGRLITCETMMKYPVSLSKYFIHDVEYQKLFIRYYFNAKILFWNLAWIGTILTLQELNK